MNELDQSQLSQVITIFYMQPPHVSTHKIFIDFNEKMTVKY
jgi:hypothetical protein